MSNSVFFQIGQCGNQLADSVWSSIRSRGLDAQCGAFLDGKVSSICVDLEPRVTSGCAFCTDKDHNCNFPLCRCCAGSKMLMPGDKYITRITCCGVIVVPRTTTLKAAAWPTLPEGAAAPWSK
jgi:hypothetical protein